MGWTVPPKWYIQVLTLIHVNVTLLRNRVFEDLIEQRWGHIRLDWDLNLMTGVLLRRGEDTQRNTHIGKKAVWAREPSQAATCCTVQGCQQPPGAGGGKEWFFSRACRHLDFRLWLSEQCKNVFIAFSHPVCSNFVIAALEINTLAFNYMLPGALVELEKINSGLRSTYDTVIIITINEKYVQENRWHIGNFYQRIRIYRKGPVKSLEINLYLSNKTCVILNLFSMASASNLKFFKT